MKRPILIAVCAVSFTVLAFMADDLSKYKVNEAEFKDRIQGLATENRFTGLNYYRPDDVIKLAKTLPAADQASMAKAVALFVKSYVNSDGFKNDLNKKLDELRSNTDPNSPDLKAEYNRA